MKDLHLACLALLFFLLAFSFPPGCADSKLSCPPCPGPAAPVVEEAPASTDVVMCSLEEPPPIPGRLKIKLFDTAVNVGVKQASKFLQAALNRLGADLTLDGKIGPKTLAALCGLSESAVLNLYAERQAQFYNDLAARNSDQVRFLKGWLGRAGWIPE